MTDKLPPQWAIDKVSSLPDVVKLQTIYVHAKLINPIAELLVQDRKTCLTELEQLRKRVTAQRRELRRLNKYYEVYWNGYKRGMNAVATDTLRNKMIKAFGQAAVRAAEQEGEK